MVGDDFKARAWGRGWIAWCLCLLLGLPGVVAAAGLGLSVEALPFPPASADGQRPIWIPVRVLDEVGDAVSGAAVSATPSEGEVVSVWETAPGLHIITLKIPATATPRAVSVAVVAALGTQKAETRIEVPLTPAGRGPSELRLDPSPFVSPRDRSATLTALARDARGLPREGASLQVRASTGKVEALAAQGSGRVQGVWTPPASRYPFIVLLATVDGADPEQYGFSTLPVEAAATFPVQAPPGVSLSFDVGGRTFGPFLTDASGTAQVSLVVPPGVDQARVVSTDPSGQSRETALDLRAPDVPRLLMAAPDSLVGSASAPVRLRLMSVKPDGSPNTQALVEVTASEGQVAELREEGGGVYSFLFTPPDTPAGADVELVARLTGGGDVQTDRVLIRLVPPGSAPARKTVARRPSDTQAWLSLTLTPSRTAQDVATDVKVVVQGFNSHGVAVPLDHPVVLASTRGTIEAQQLRTTGEMVARLSLPALPAGSRVVVVAADPELGQSTWNQVMIGPNTRRAAPTDGESAQRAEPPLPAPQLKAETPPAAPPAKAETPPAEPQARVEPPPAEPQARVETPPAEPQAKAETPPAEPQARVETPPAEPQARVEPPPTEPQARVEPPPAEPQAKVEPPPAEPQARVETPPAEPATVEEELPPTPDALAPTGADGAASPAAAGPAPAQASAAEPPPVQTAAAAPEATSGAAPQPARLEPPPAVVSISPTPTPEEEPVRRAPPPAGLAGGSRIYPLYPVGYYVMTQTPVEDGLGVVPAEEISLTSPTLLGLGVGADYWFTPELGLSARYLSQSYGFLSDGTVLPEGYLSDFKQIGTFDVRARRWMGKGGVGTSLGGRVGLTRQDWPTFDVAKDGEVSFNSAHHLIFARAGVDVGWLVGPHMELWLAADGGLSLARDVTTHAEAGLSWRLTETTSVGVAAELWRRSMVSARQGVDPAASLQDTWALGWVFLGLHH